MFESIKKVFQKQKDIAPVEIVSSKIKVNLRSLEDPTFRFENSSEISDWYIDLDFETAFQIERADWAGIKDLIFKVNGRKFQDLSFLHGKDIQDFDSKEWDYVNKLCEYDDGKRFFYHYHSIPTFDSDDRDWDGSFSLAMFKDEFGIHLIKARYGYNLPRISIYLTLKNIPDRLKNWLEFLN